MNYLTAVSLSFFISISVLQPLFSADKPLKSCLKKQKVPGEINRVYASCSSVYFAHAPGKIVALKKPSFAPLCQLWDIHGNEDTESISAQEIELAKEALRRDLFLARQNGPVPLILSESASFLLGLLGF